MNSAPPTSSRTDALARAAVLARRARELRRMQVEVQKLTAHEVEVLARTAASFFDAIPLPEFTTKLLPQSERGLRRIRHRILHRTINTTATGTLIRALLLGSDGALRLFSARSAVSRELLLILEPGRALPAGVVREVVDWTPMLRVPQFRPFEILEKISRSLDAVEEQIADAEARVNVQLAALVSGDLSALMPADDTAEGEPEASAGPPANVRPRAAAGVAGAVAATPAAAGVTARPASAVFPTDASAAVSPQQFAAEFAREARDRPEPASVVTPRPAGAAGVGAAPGAPTPVADVQDVFGAVGLFDMFQRVEIVADAAARGDDVPESSGFSVAAPGAGRGEAMNTAAAPVHDSVADEPGEWDDSGDDLPLSKALMPPASGVAASARSLFPVMPAPR